MTETVWLALITMIGASLTAAIAAWLGTRPARQAVIETSAKLDAVASNLDGNLATIIEMAKQSGIDQERQTPTKATGETL